MGLIISTLMNGAGAAEFWQKAKVAVSSFGLIQYLPIWETSGTSVQDISGLGNNAVHINVFPGQPGAGDGKLFAYYKNLSTTNALSAGLVTAFGNGKEGWAWVVGKMNLTTTWTNVHNSELFRFTGDSSNFVYIRKTTTNNQLGFLYRSNASNALVTDASLAGTDDLFDAGITWSKTNNRMRAYINGAQVGTDQTVGAGNWTANPVLSIATVGAELVTSPLECHVGYLGDFMMGAGVEGTPALMLALHNLRMSLLTKNMVFEGDSLTRGDGVPNYPDQSYPNQLVGRLAGCDFFNYATGGTTIVTMLTRTATIDAKYNAGRTCYAILEAGIVDLVSVATAATIYANLKTWWAGRKALGFRVIPHTLASNTNCYASAPLEAVRVALNTLIRSDPTLYYRLADVAADARLGNVDSCLNETYFAVDHVHPNATGCTVQADIVQAVL